MCILLSSTSHPDYPFILLSNRDEYFARATQMATLRSSHNGSQILTPLDLARPERGTWIGVTDEGKLAVLVNYREKLHILSKVSRGVLPLQYLQSNQDDDQWYENLESILSETSHTGKPVSLDQIGRFTLVYGKLNIDESGQIKPLNLMSNRGDRDKVHSSSITMKSDSLNESTFGLSNSRYNSPWPKVKLGISLLHETILKSVQNHYDHEQLLDACFKVLSTDTYDPKIRYGASFDAKLQELANSIFIPPLETHFDVSSLNLAVGKYYGTRTQVVILLHKSGKLYYHEKDLHCGDTDVQEVRTQKYSFDLPPM